MVNFNSSYSSNIKLDFNTVSSEKVSYTNTYKPDIKPVDFKTSMKPVEVDNYNFELTKEGILSLPPVPVQVRPSALSCLSLINC